MTQRAIIWAAVSTRGQADEDEKNSLPTQEGAARRLCEEHGWDVIDVLVVPGHSRRYIDIHDCARAMRQKGIDAFDKLLAHFDARDFDLLIVRDSDRFARTQTLHAYVVERTIAVGARIYSLADGWVNQQNYRFFISMAGYKASAEIDGLVEKSKTGKQKTIERGMTTTQPFFSHLVQRDERGHREKLVLNPAYTRFFLDMAVLLLQRPRLSWNAIADRLNALGHRTPTGSLWTGNYVQATCEHPQAHGHIAGHFSWRSGIPRRYALSGPLPDGMQMQRDAVPPVWPDDVRVAVERELDVRRANGPRRSPVGKFKFTGLMVCARCGYSMVAGRNGKGTSITWYCETARISRTPYAYRRKTTCDNRKHINDKLVQWWFADKLPLGIGAFAPPIVPADPLLAERLSALDADAAKLSAQIDRWIGELAADLSDRVRRQIRTSLNDADARLHALEIQRAELTVQLSEDNQLPQRQAALAQARETPDFWSQEPAVINQMLRNILGPWRLAIDDGLILELVDPR